MGQARVNAILGCCFLLVCLAGVGAQDGYGELSEAQAWQEYSRLEGNLRHVDPADPLYERFSRQMGEVVARYEALRADGGGSEERMRAMVAELEARGIERSGQSGVAQAEGAVPQAWSGDVRRIDRAGDRLRQAQAELRAVLGREVTGLDQQLQQRADVERAHLAVLAAERELAWHAGEIGSGYSMEEQERLREASTAYGELESLLEERAGHDARSLELLQLMREAEAHYNGALQTMAENGVGRPSVSSGMGRNGSSIGDPALYQAAFMRMLYQRLAIEQAAAEHEMGKIEPQILALLGQAHGAFEDVLATRTGRGIDAINQALASEGSADQFALGEPATGHEADLLQRWIRELQDRVMSGSPLDGELARREALASEHAPIVSRFEAGAEGWTVVGDAQGESSAPTFAGGHVHAKDDAAGGVWYWSAPAKFLGDRSSCMGRTLSFALRTSATDEPFDDHDVVLSGGGRTLVLDTDTNPGISWTSYRVVLNGAAGWRHRDSGDAASEHDLQAVLSDLQSLLIRGEFRTGADEGDLDDVVLGNM